MMNEMRDEKQNAWVNEGGQALKNEWIESWIWLWEALRMKIKMKDYVISLAPDPSLPAGFTSKL